MNLTKRLTNVLTIISVLYGLGATFALYLSDLDHYDYAYTQWLANSKYAKLHDYVLPEPSFYDMTMVSTYPLALLAAIGGGLIITATVSYIGGAGFKVWHK